jgi:uncharacterized membrane protein YeaQ/YmgE (transglycosylase-associated protein family)
MSDELTVATVTIAAALVGAIIILWVFHTTL